ncbi:hypothetical protein FRB96_008456 [Tulasnella sp. 330]|nr:hypothetical protein FRB96_008456 [Tulasnella sp. 330]KAG8889304.1 hypothetical protein FRB98_004921 [Tulasnella sp. 332]
MLALSHQQPTMYVQANSQPSYYYVQAQPTAAVPAGQWTTGGQQQLVNHSGSAYVLTNPGYRPVVYQHASQQPLQQQQIVHHGQQTFAVTTAPQQMQVKPAQPQQVIYAQPPQMQRTFSGGSVHSSSSSRQNSIPVMDANGFEPVSPVMSEATTLSDDSSSSFSSASGSSRYNLPSSAINHYTAPSRERQRRNSFVNHQQLSRHPQPYAIPSAGQSSLSLPPPQVSQPMYTLQSQQFSHPSIPTSSQQQPAFVRNTGRSDHPVSYQPDQHQQVYSSFELYKPSPGQQQQQHHRSRSTTLSRRSLSAHAAPVPLTSSSYGDGLGMSMGGGAGGGMGMGYGGGQEDSGDKKWWKLGR